MADDEQEIEYDDEGNVIEREKEAPPIIEIPPITEDNDIDHEQMNKQLVEMCYRRGKTNVVGREVQKQIKDGLSKISNNYDKTACSFTKMTVSDKKLTKLYDFFEQYPRIRDLNLSKNLLADVMSITHMTYLQTLDVSGNKIASLNILSDENGGKLKFLKTVNLTNNRLTRMEKITIPRLEKLILDENQITTCENFTGHDRLKILSLKKNKLTNLKGISHCANLEVLYVNENQITTFENLYDLPALRKINFKLNPLEKIAVTETLPSLRQFNFKETQLVEREYIWALLIFKKLANVNQSGAPLGEDGEMKRDLLIKKRDLVKFNKEEITEDDREEAGNEERRRIEEEEERLKQEEDERLRAEEEARQKAAEDEEED